MKTSRIIALAAMATFLTHGTSIAQHEHHHAATDATSAYGTVDFAVSCEEDAAGQFQTGLALLHHMMYEQAEAAFRSAAEHECAMAYWGIAMSQLHPLWAPPTETELKKGAEAAARARELGPPTEREQLYVEAVAAFFETEGDFGTRLQAWDAAQAKVLEHSPDDVDAGAFHALARLATAPRGDMSFARQTEVGTLLENLHERAPEHPGLFHYTIHAYDNPALADRADEVASGYDKLAPDVPHALHMPSHIFVRVGRWQDVVDWNRRSAEAALKHPVGDQTSMHYAHAIDYLVYAYLQMGRDDLAAEAVAELMQKKNVQPHIGSGYSFAAAPARYALERRAWSEAANLPVRKPETFAWEKFPAAESMTHFARGLGAARTGDLDAAREAVRMLEQIEEKLKDDAYWVVHTKAQRKAVSAWIAYAEGDRDRALEMMRAAADVEDSVDKHPVTPSAVLPARELLGEMLLAMERPAEALEAFEQSLAISRNRLNSLSGAGRAAELAGDRAAAGRYYAMVVDLVKDNAADRSRISDARAFVKPD